MDQNNPYPEYNQNDNDPYHRPAENEAGQDRKDESLGYRKPGRAITSMVLGISSVSLWFYPFLTSIPCLIMGIIAVKLASNSDGQTDPKYNGFLKAGKITGVIGIILSAVYTVVMLFAVMAAVSQR